MNGCIRFVPLGEGVKGEAYWKRQPFMGPITLNEN
jgi:hypothetical protein